MDKVVSVVGRPLGNQSGSAFQNQTGVIAEADDDSIRQ